MQKAIDFNDVAVVAVVKEMISEFIFGKSVKMVL